MKGSICLTIEETTTSQWLYTELKDCVEKLVICDPYRNRLLSEGAKTDKIDAEKLVKLLKADLLKEVFLEDNRCFRNSYRVNCLCFFELTFNKDFINK